MDINQKLILTKELRKNQSIIQLREKSMNKFQKQLDKQLKNAIKQQKAEAIDYLKRKRIEEKVYLDKRRIDILNQIKQSKQKCIMDCNASGNHGQTIKWWRCWDMLIDPRQWSVDGTHMQQNKCHKCIQIRDNIIHHLNELEEEYQKVIILLQNIRIMNDNQ